MNAIGFNIPIIKEKNKHNKRSINSFECVEINRWSWKQMRFFVNSVNIHLRLDWNIFVVDWDNQTLNYLQKMIQFKWLNAHKTPNKMIQWSRKSLLPL